MIIIGKVSTHCLSFKELANLPLVTTNLLPLTLPVGIAAPSCPSESNLLVSLEIRRSDYLALYAVLY